MLNLFRRPSARMALAVPAVLILAVGSATAAPASDREKVYLPGRYKLVALDKKTGRAAWEAPLWSSGPAVPPVITPERLYVIENGRALKSFDAATGKLAWQTPAVTCIQPVLAGELLVVVAGDTARALNRWTGKKVWEYNSRTFPDWKFDQNTVPVIAGNRALMPAGCTLIALDLATGQPAWAHTASAAKLPLQPAVVSEMVYIRSERDGIGVETALKLEDGLPDTGEYTLPPDIARAVKRERNRQQSRLTVPARPANTRAKQPSIAVQAKVTPNGQAIAAAGARRWSFRAPAGWSIASLAGEAPGHVYALLYVPSSPSR
jgi:outer membrane protein assembly factor BamB